VRPFDRQRILLGVTAGIASFKAAWLASGVTDVRPDGREEPPPHGR